MPQTDRCRLYFCSVRGFSAVTGNYWPNLIIFIIRPVLDPLHDLSVSLLHLAVVGPLGWIDLLVAGELGGPAQVEPRHDHGQVEGLYHLVVSSNLGNLQHNRSMIDLIIF